MVQLKLLQVKFQDDHSVPANFIGQSITNIHMYIVKISRLKQNLKDLLHDSTYLKL